MAIPFPFQLPPGAVQFRKAAVSRSGGRSLSGSQQTVRSDAGYWEATVTVQVPSAGARGEERTLAYWAFFGALDGMAGEVLVPAPMDWRPYDINGRMVSANGAGIGFGPAQGWGLAPVESAVTLAQAADFGATRIVINHPGVPALRPGHFFGIGERLYVIWDAWSLDFERTTQEGALLFNGDPLLFDGEPLVLGGEGGRTGANVQVLQFWPKLRGQARAGAPVIIGAPVCKMQLASDSTGALDRVRGGVGSATFEFAEVY